MPFSAWAMVPFRKFISYINGPYNTWSDADNDAAIIYEMNLFYILAEI